MRRANFKGDFESQRERLQDIGRVKGVTGETVRKIVDDVCSRVVIFGRQLRGPDFLRLVDQTKLIAEKVGIGVDDIDFYKYQNIDHIKESLRQKGIDLSKIKKVKTKIS